MFDGTLAAWLQQLTQEYVQSRTSDVRLGIGGGQLVLDNAELRVDAINKLLREARAPLSILRASVGRLRIHVPWSALTSSPVKVYLENVHMLATLSDNASASSEFPDATGHRASIDEDSQLRKSGSSKLASSKSKSRKSSSKSGKSSKKPPQRSETSNSSSIPGTELQHFLANGGASMSPATGGTTFGQAASDGTRAEKARDFDPLSYFSWYKTMLGRLVFNIELEVNSLKLEYSDSECRGWVSCASILANSADADWHKCFNQIDPSSVDIVVMRKLFSIQGLTVAFIPRQPQMVESRLASRGGAHAVSELFLNMFETEFPIINGLGLTLKVLLSASGDQSAGSEGNSEEAVACEAALEIDDPDFCVSARQMRWLLEIMALSSCKISPQEETAPFRCSNCGEAAKSSGLMIPAEHASGHGLGMEAGSFNSLSEPVHEHMYRSDADRDTTDLDVGDVGASDSQDRRSKGRALKRDKRQDKSKRPRPKPLPARAFLMSEEESILSEIESVAEKVHGGMQRAKPQRNCQASDVDPVSNEPDSPEPEQGHSRTGPFSRIWAFITGDTGKELANDPADLLGFEPYEYVDEIAQAEMAVKQARESGGITMVFKLRTPDHEARQRAEKLAQELQVERELRLAAMRGSGDHGEGSSSVLDPLAHIQELEAEIERLRTKNKDLKEELVDLERLVSDASASKDSIIRQMEAALLKAERNLMSLLEKVAFSGNHSAVVSSSGGPGSRAQDHALWLEDNQLVGGAGTAADSHTLV
ncbi:Vacuolar protein sorting-associated protein 13b [Porphyridium purpureum]|uniref:Vacuolar protein sorting-associated protein 13b n=1 Tax=Porphyridium purpureum TaxID=35688 RepID=A0A5J4YM53_PORPP|nr:Vacuolar protein sorting-associated protein 13b [Porphyridium purpureum]|eukprot:POR6908..scf249_10